MKKISGMLLIAICLLSAIIFASAEDNVCITHEASNVTYYSAQLNGSITFLPEEVSEYGFVIYESGGQEENIVLGISTDTAVEFSHTVIVLADTKYFYKTYAKTTENKITYGEPISFTTKSRPQHQMPVINFNLQVENPENIDIAETPNMFYLNNLIVNQRDKLQLIAGQNFYGQNAIGSAGDDPILLNQFFMNHYNKNVGLNTLLTIFDAMYNYEGYAFDLATTIVVPDEIIGISDNDELKALIYELCGDMKYRRYAGALNEALKCDYTSSDRRTFGFEEGNYLQYAYMSDVVNTSNEEIKTLKNVYESLKDYQDAIEGMDTIANEYVSKVMQRYITAGKKALALNKHINTHNLSSIEKREYINQLSDYLQDYRTYASWNFSDEQLANWKATFESKLYAPKSFQLAESAGFVLGSIGGTLNAFATTEQLVANKDLFQEMFLRLKQETKNRKLSTILGDYANNTEAAFASDFIDAASSIATTYKDTILKSTISDLIDETVSLKIANTAGTANRGAAAASYKKIANINYLKLAMETGLFFSQQISGTKTFLEKTIELKYLYNIENDSISMLQKDLNAYVANPTEEGAQKVLKDLTWIKSLRLRGITIVNEMYQSNSKSLLGKVGTVLGSTTASAVNAVYISQRDALIRASLYENGYTSEPLTLNNGDEYVIYQADGTTDKNGALHGVGFSDACGRLAGGVTLNSGSTLIITNANAYIPYIKMNGGTLNISSGANVTVGEMECSSGNINIAGTLLLENSLKLSETSTLLVSGIMNIGGDLYQKGSVVLSDGKMYINGNYTRGVEFNERYGSLSMTHDNDYILVNGDYSELYRSTPETLTAGTIEIKGNLSTAAYAGNSSGTHKTILSGDKGQTISASNVRFNILQLLNTSQEGITFNTTTYITKEIIPNNSTINNANNICLTGTAKPNNNVWNYDITLSDWQNSESITFNKTVYVGKNVVLNHKNIIKGSLVLNYSSKSFIINAEQEINGNMIIDVFCDVEVNAPLKIGGDLVQKGNAILNNGKIYINGNYTRGVEFNDNHGLLNMTHDNDYILVSGDYSELYHSTPETLTAGTIEIKGNLTNYAYYKYPGGTHKTILSGGKKQNLNTSGKCFNILEIANTSAEGVNFNNTVSVSGKILQSVGTKLINAQNVKLQNQAAFVDYGSEVNANVNRYVGNHESVIPTWLDYQEYSLYQEIIGTTGLKLSDISSVVTENAVSGAVTVTNNDKDYEDAQLIVAVYSGQKLIGISVTEIDSNKETKTQQSYNVTCWEPAAQAALKVMLWENLSEIAPVCEFVQSEIAIQ